MDCPKCGASQDDGRDECASCGVVFARWRAAQERAQLRVGAPPQTAPESERGIPAWAAIVALIVVVGLGVMWTVRRREARASHDPSKELDAKVNAINNRINASRVREAQDAARSSVAAQEARIAQMHSEMADLPPAPAPWPSGLDESSARSMIQRCSGFTNLHEISIPKSFRRQDRVVMIRDVAPLEPAVRAGFLELVDEGDFTYVRVLGPGWTGLQAVDAGDSYKISGGRRVVKNVRLGIAGASTVEVWFTWNYDRMDARDLFGTREEPHGNAHFARTGSSWRAVRGSIGSGKLYVPICR